MPTSQEIELIRELQKGFDVCENPFAEMGKRVGMSEDEVVSKLQAWKSSGIIRRAGVIVNHYKAGFGANGMCVWDIPEDRLEEVGQRFSKHAAITHCYARPKSERWPYRLYTMIHAHERSQVEAIAGKLAEQEGIETYRILYSKREIKKAPTRLFMEEMDSQDS